MLKTLDNSFQSRYNRLPIATYAISEPSREAETPFCWTHYHKEFEVLGIIAGECRFTMDNVTCRAGAGDLLLIPPYVVHEGYILPGADFSYYCFSFDLGILQDDQFTGLLEDGTIDVKRHISPSDPASEELCAAAHGVFTQSEERQEGWDYLIRGQMLCLFGLLRQHGYVDRSDRRELQCEFGLQVLAALSRDYGGQISSKDLAEQLSYSHSYFCRKFQKIFSMSFQQYLGQYRLSKARMLLAEEMSVAEVAEKVGYNSVSFFIRQFRDLYGYTPGQFRNMQARAQA